MTGQGHWSLLAKRVWPNWEIVALNEDRRFRNALGKFATGVTVVTTATSEGEPVGVTASSFNSVSLDPPLVLWSLAKSAKSMEAFSTSGHFAVHILAASQEDISNRFARPGADKFDGIGWTPSTLGSPLLPDCAAQFQCKTSYQYEGGDHVIFVGEVIGFEETNKSPLVFHGGVYAEAKPKLSDDGESGVDLEQGSFTDDFLFYLLARAHFQATQPVREEWRKTGMSESEYLTLSVLSMHDHLTPEALHEQLDHTGRAPDPDILDHMIKQGWIDKGADDTLSFTETGRSIFINILSRSKAVEEQLVSHFAPGELAEAKRLLRRIIEITDQDG